MVNVDAAVSAGATLHVVQKCDQPKEFWTKGVPLGHAQYLEVLTLEQRGLEYKTHASPSAFRKWLDSQPSSTESLLPDLKTAQEKHRRLQIVVFACYLLYVVIVFGVLVFAPTSLQEKRLLAMLPIILNVVSVVYDNIEAFSTNTEDVANNELNAAIASIQAELQVHGKLPDSAKLLLGAFSLCTALFAQLVRGGIECTLDCE